MDRGRLKDPATLANDIEVSALRGLLGKINWATREGMPQGAGDASLLSATLPKPTVRDISEANATLRRLLAHDFPIRIWSTPLKSLRYVVFADASLHNAGGGSAQTAHLICATEPKPMRNECALVSVLSYKISIEFKGLN